MSDERGDAQQQLQDALGSSLSHSFEPPAPAPRKKEPQSIMAAFNEQAEVPEPAESEPRDIPGMAEWKDTYESYVKTWTSEHDEARKIADETRERLEREAADVERKVKDEEKRRQAEVKAKKAEEENEERLRRELEDEAQGKKRLGKKAAKQTEKDEKEKRDAKVKEAWEMVKGGSAAGASAAGHEVVTDARGVMPQDVMAGQTKVSSQSKPSQSAEYDAAASVESLPTTQANTTPSSPTSQARLSRSMATSQAWEEVSAPSGEKSGSGSTSQSSSSGAMSSPELININEASGPLGKSMTDPVPHAITPLGLSRVDDDRSLSRSGPHGTQPPEQPPSLTLSIFTMPSHVSASRVLAVLGINLVLPFLNGVMLGFGEIFAREVFRVGKLVWRGERSLFGWRSGAGRRWGDAETGLGQGQSSGGRGVQSVGLSGSGGFP